MCWVLFKYHYFLAYMFYFLGWTRIESNQNSFTVLEIPHVIILGWWKGVNIWVLGGWGCCKVNEQGLLNMQLQQELLRFQWAIISIHELKMVENKQQWLLMKMINVWNAIQLKSDKDIWVDVCNCVEITEKGIMIINSWWRIELYQWILISGLWGRLGELKISDYCLK